MSVWQCGNISDDTPTTYTDTSVIFLTEWDLPVIDSDWPNWRRVPERKLHHYWAPGCCSYPLQTQCQHCCLVQSFFLGGGVGQTTRKAVPLLTNLLVFTYTAPWPWLSAIERVLPLITFSISSCDYSCNIFTAEQLESEQSKSTLKGVLC